MFRGGGIAPRQDADTPEKVAKYNMLYKIAEVCAGDKHFMKEVLTIVEVRACVDTRATNRSALGIWHSTSYM